MYRRKYKNANFSVSISFLKNLAPNPKLPSIHAHLATHKAANLPLQPKKTKRILVNHLKNAIFRPRQTFRQGMIADYDANLLAKTRGYTRRGLTRRVVSKALSSKPDEGIVAASGFLTSQLGKRFGGKPGEVAGDLAGTYLARRSIEDGRSLLANGRRLMRSPTYKSMPIVQRARKLVSRVTNNAKALHSPYKSEVPNDGIGWVVGNSVGDTMGDIGHIPVGITVPVATGAAIATTDIIRKGVQETGKYPLNRVLQRTGRRLRARFNLNRQIRKGLKREQRAFNGLNRFLGLGNNQ